MYVTGPVRTMPEVPPVQLTREALMVHGGHADPLRRALAESMDRLETHSLTMPEGVDDDARQNAREYMGYLGFETRVMPWVADHEALGNLVEVIPCYSDHESHADMNDNTYKT